MQVDQTPAVTGPLRAGLSDTQVVAEWLRMSGTGDDYGGVFLEAKVWQARLWGVPIRTAQGVEYRAGASDEESLQSRAAVMAREVSAVATERPRVPQLTGDLLEDARAVTGLTLDQIAHGNRVSGRAVAGWRAGRVPRQREPFLQSLRSIGLSLVGGLGPRGVQRWLLTGTPSRLDRLAAGDVEGVVAEARAYHTSPAT